LREYEVIVVLKPDLDEEARSQVIERVEGWLGSADDDSTELNVKHWGQRNLAYPIMKYTEGYYLLYDLELDPTKISDIERNILYMDDVLRHLLVRKQS
jgi:small subunit ribosomal protein S6